LPRSCWRSTRQGAASELDRFIGAGETLSPRGEETGGRQADDAAARSRPVAAISEATEALDGQDQSVLAEALGSLVEAAQTLADALSPRSSP
jgi:hypothetical protein